ncbi:DUF5682 family protein [Brevibacterium litoralis]|uniref:DUF5682 family protein n=1 Tax=Brevibacterium litoralis TaxID=3138935 RepID=UPI0032EF953E
MASEGLEAAILSTLESGLIGVRHHSPALARVMPELLDAVAPAVLAIELPPEAAAWVDLIAHPQARAPLALALAPRVGDDAGGPLGSGGPGGGWEDSPSFYPFAEVSPELVALRWARENGVPVECIDLSVTVRWVSDDVPLVVTDPSGDDGAGEDGAARRRARERLPDWDTAVEARTVGAGATAVRRAALAYGTGLRMLTPPRASGPGEDRRTLLRESAMREGLRRARESARERSADGPVVAVIGAFHAPALVNALVTDTELAAADRAALRGASASGRAAGDNAAAGTAGRSREVVTSLVPYESSRLDARSGYPAGVLDPEWHHRVLEVGEDPDGVQRVAAEMLTDTARRVRAEGYPCGTGEVTEAVRLAQDLASLRGLPAAGRSELWEAVDTVFAQGEDHGRGRAVREAAHRALVGTRHGKVAPGTPEPALAEAVVEDLRDLRLLDRALDPVRRREVLRLDPLRSPLDARREVFFARTATAGMAVANPVEGTGVGGVATVTTRWQLVDPAVVRARAAGRVALGTRTDQVARAVLRHELRAVASEQGDSGGSPAAGSPVTGLGHGGAGPAERASRVFRKAVACGLTEVAAQALAAVRAGLPGAGLDTVLDVVGDLDSHTSRSVAGARVAGMERLDAAVAQVRKEALAALVPLLDGLAGSTDPADARRLGDLARTVGGEGVRLHAVLDRLATTAAPTLAAGALAAREVMDPGSRLGTLVAEARRHVTGGSTADRRHRMQQWLAGFLAAAGHLVIESEEVRAGLAEAVEALADRDFVARLPALRSGFEVLDDRACDRLLAQLGRTRGEGSGGRVGSGRGARGDVNGSHAGSGRGARPEVDPDLLVLWAQEDQEAADRVAAGLASAAFSPAERWKLVLGRHGGSLRAGSPAGRLARVLERSHGARTSPGEDDGLGGYGGDGADGGTHPGDGAGDGPPEPMVRRWDEIDLADLFGEDVRDEVLATAAAHGDTSALLALDPEAVTPSADLLTDLLNLARGMPEGRVEKLRPLVQRCVDALAAALRTELRPALTGLGTNRRTRRRTRLFDAAATIRANLTQVVALPDGTRRIVPRDPIFRQRAMQHVGWHVVVLVDVSGSMERSTVFAALTAAVLAGVPSLSVSFLTFSTQVADLSEHVDDPLSLLLEVAIGGGTDIGRGLDAAAAAVQVPERTLLAVITDFQDGGERSHLLGRVRALAESGVAMLGCAALDDDGQAVYDVAVARQVAAAGMPVAAVTPAGLAGWVRDVVGSRK